MASTSLVQVRADQALQQCAIPALRQLQIEESDREIVLSGSVRCYYHKQLAQEAIMPILGARKLSNRILVDRS
jgi:hypothetical protein